MPISPEPLEGDVVEHGIKKAGISYKDCDKQKDLTSYSLPTAAQAYIGYNQTLVMLQ